MMAPREQAGLGLNHLLTGLLPPDPDYRYTALIVIAWAFVAIFVIFVVFLFTSIY